MRMLSCEEFPETTLCFGGAVVKKFALRWKMIFSWHLMNVDLTRPVGLHLSQARCHPLFSLGCYDNDEHTCKCSCLIIINGYNLSTITYSAMYIVSHSHPYISALSHSHPFTFTPIHIHCFIFTPIRIQAHSHLFTPVFR